MVYSRKSLVTKRFLLMGHLLFAALFIPFAIIVGELIHRQGKKLVFHALGEASPVAEAVATLLRIGWYLITTGLLLWNLGTTFRSAAWEPMLRDVSLRLGIAIFAVGVLHGLNILSLSLFHRKNAGATGPAE